MSTRVLAIDTTSESGSLALVEDDRVVDEIELRAPEGHAQMLHGEIEKLLARHGWSIDSIDIFAGASGPGTFTGVRVGLAAMQGLAGATGKTAVGVSNLRAIASFGSAPIRAVLFDARRGEIYGGVYDADLAEVQPEVVTPLAAWKAALPEGAELLSPEAEAFGATPVPRAIAGAIGRIAQRFPAPAEANYIRRPDAETQWKESR